MFRLSKSFSVASRPNQYQKRHWRPSPYSAYSNLLFMHVHARLSDGELPQGFWNGFSPDNGRNQIVLQLSASFSDEFLSLGIRLLAPIKAVIGSRLPSSHALLSGTQTPFSQNDIISWGILLWSLLSCLS